MHALFIGLGGIGQRHLRNYKELFPDGTVSAVRHSKRTFEISADLEADTSINIIEKFQIAEYSTISSAVRDRQPDFAIIASPSNSHMPQTLELLKAGVPVLLEKPISTSGKYLDQISSLLKLDSHPVMVGYMMRFHPAVLKFRDLFSESIVGKVFSAKIIANTYMPEWHAYEQPKDFYAGRRDLGGGAVLTCVHFIDLMVWLFGRPQRLWTLGGAMSKFDFDVEDATVSLFEYDWPVSFHLSFVQKPVENSITIFGEEGMLRMDLGLSKVTFEGTSKPNAEYEFPDYEWNDMFIDELRHFTDCLTTGAKLKSTFEDVLDGHLVALAMKKSLKSGNVLKL